MVRLLISQTNFVCVPNPFQGARGEKGRIGTPGDPGIIVSTSIIQFYYSVKY